MITLIFGVIDLTLQAPVFFKFEAGLSNLLVAFFFGATVFTEKPLIQEFAEQKKSFADRDPRDVRFYFQFMTIVWTVYFVAKAIAYTYINFHTDAETALLIRGTLGNTTLAALLAISILGGRTIWIALDRLGFMPSARTKKAPPERSL